MDEFTKHTYALILALTERKARKELNGEQLDTILVDLALIKSNYTEEELIRYGLLSEDISYDLPEIFRELDISEAHVNLIMAQVQCTKEEAIEALLDKRDILPAILYINEKRSTPYIPNEACNNFIEKLHSIVDHVN